VSLPEQYQAASEGGETLAPCPHPTVPRPARELRRDQTLYEAMLWKLIGNRQLSGYKFRRQMPIGPYFADFACPARV